MSLDRRVLNQDQPQYEEQTRKARAEKEKKDYEKAKTQYEKEQADIDNQNKDIEKQNAANEAKYNSDILEFNSRKSEKEKIEAEYQRQRDAVNAENERIKAEIRAHDSEYVRRLGQVSPSVKDELQNQERRTSEKLAEIKRNEQRSLNVQTFRESGQPLTKAAYDTFNKTGGQASLLDLNTKQIESQEAQRVARVQASQQNTLNTKQSYTELQKQVISAEHVGYLGGGTPKQEARSVAAQKRETKIPEGTVFPFVPKVAQDADQVRHLTNVNTGQSIGKNKEPLTNVVANPRAFVAGLQRNIPQAGTPIREEVHPLVQTGKIRVSNLEDWNGQQTKKVRVSDPMIDRMVGAYGYEKTNEIIGNYNLSLIHI